jgi:hypothetical protein
MTSMHLPFFWPLFLCPLAGLLIVVLVPLNVLARRAPKSELVSICRVLTWSSLGGYLILLGFTLLYPAPRHPWHRDKVPDIRSRNDVDRLVLRDPDTPGIWVHAISENDLLYALAMLPLTDFVTLAADFSATDATMGHLAAVPRIADLTIEDASAVTDSGLLLLPRIKSIRSLTILRAHQISQSGLAQLRSRMPQCRIVICTDSEWQHTKTYEPAGAAK